jgi:hypothetical protein
MRWHEIFEDASAGASCASNIAVSVGAQGGIGAGFNPNGDWGIYNSAKKKGKKGKKSAMLRR